MPAEAAPKRLPVPLLVGGGIFALGLLVFVAVLLWRGEEPAAPESPPAVAEQQVAEAPLPQKKAPVESDKADATKGMRFLDPIDTGPAPPSVPAPADPVRSPAPKVPEPIAAPRPPPPPPPVVSVADQLKDFNAGLKKSAEASNTCKFSAALKQLNDLKSKYAAAPWWNEHREEWSKAERVLQEQLADYNNEATDALQQAQKSSDPKSLDKTEALWKPRAGGSNPTDAGKWHLPEVLTMNAASGAMLTRQSDGSILVSGNNPPTDGYTIVTRTYLGGITAFRLEALPDPSLPSGGPGRAGNGNFALSLFAVDCAPLDNPAARQRVGFSKASDSYHQVNNSADKALLGRADTWWDINSQTGNAHAAVFETATPVGPDTGSQLTFTLAFKTGHAQHALGRFRLLATSAKNPPPPQTPVGDVVLATGPAGDELGGKPAWQVLLAVRKARARIAEQQRAKRLTELGQQLDTFEKQLKLKSRTPDQVLKALDEIDAELARDQLLAEKLVEHAAVLRFDATLAKDGELGIYRTTVRSAGGAAEVLYDFSTPEQFQVWSMDNPANCGSVEHDAKNKLVRIKTIGGHNWDGRDRKGVPVFRLPFYFRPESWSFEATATLVSDANKKDKPDYGILVWDGGSAVVRFSIKELTAKDMGAIVGASMPAKDNFWSKPTGLAAKAKERVRLQMTCEQGAISCMATNASGGTARVHLSFKLGFEPRGLGVFVRTNDGGENACVSFEAIRIIGVPNREKFKELADAGRNTAMVAAKTALELRKTLQGNIAPLGKAASLSGWKTDGASGPVQCAIDNRMDTFWDEEDGKPEYRLAVAFDQVHTVNAITIVGFQHQDHAPKDFAILADGKVVKEVRDAVYTDNFLRVEFPATPLKTLELKITGCYGASPGIRELGIYEP